jgi:C-terminal processing protease CtpA/Prc
LKSFTKKALYQLFQYSLLIVYLSSCAANKNLTYNPNKKIAPEKLNADFDLLQNILVKEHPSTYWYTPKETIDAAFANAKTQLKDSLNEIQFRQIVSRVVAQIKCGHTSVRASKAFEKWIGKADLSYFPFGARVYHDSLIATYNLYRKDTLLKRGTVINSINGISSKVIIDSIFQGISTDGNSNNHKNIRVSNNFPFYHLVNFDTSKLYVINYKDSTGFDKSITVNLYRVPPKDTTKKKDSTIKSPSTPIVKLTKRQIKKFNRSNNRRVVYDTLNSTAFITLNTFSGSGHKRFYRKTFKQIQSLNYKNIVLDVRNNGGGLISNSTALTKYLAQSKFKVADTIFANKRFSQYNKYIKNRFWYGVSMLFLTTKRTDGKQHFGFYERRYYKPKNRYHFDGAVYIIIGGNSFSATTLFTTAIQKQANVTTVGEETGGGAYGNSAVYIPDITLPYSKLRVRLPVFRLVIPNHGEHDGRGIIPKYYVPPTVEALRTGVDNKMDKVKELIKLQQ